MKTMKVLVPAVVGILLAWFPGPRQAGAVVPAEEPGLQDYAKPGQLDAVPAGKATLYRVPWRSNVRTASGRDALRGVGVYYKHIPAWTVEQQTQVMKQMAAAGVRRLRLAPHHAMYIDKDWTAPKPQELAQLRNEMRACKAAGIRPCVTFVHLPMLGDDEQVQAWAAKTWRKKVLKQGAPGSQEYKTYLDKNYLAMKVILDTAREAGFTDPASYDLEMGQNLWWGFPAMPPFPGLTLKDLQPGGLVYEFDKALMRRAREEGYTEPALWWSQCYHYFDRMTDREVPAGAAGRAISFYSPYAGTTDSAFVGSDEWPKRDPLTFLEGTPPKVVLCKPEGFMADFSRHDNLLLLLRSAAKPVAITSLGVVPADIPGLMKESTNAAGRKVRTKAEGVDGWALKSRGLTRSYAFWLNQGVPFVLIHSAYEHKNDEMSHALMPYMPDPMKFTWRQSKPLKTMRAFCEPLRGARKVDKLDKLSFRYALSPDPVLIPATGKAEPLKASDAVALLTFQLDRMKFAVAAYVVTPNIAEPMKPVTMTLRIDKAVAGNVATRHPSTQAKGTAAIVRRDDASTTIRVPVRDDVTWLVFRTK